MLLFMFNSDIVMLRVILITVLMASSQLPMLQARDRGVQELLYERAPQGEWATIPLSCWSDFTNKDVPQTSVVVGSGFLVNDQGYFITAGHVAKTDHVGTDAAPIPCKLKATLRQADRNAFAASIELIEVDSEHDHALCKIQGFVVRDEKHELAANAQWPRTSWHPFASFAIETADIRQGEMVLLSGFPLGSWTQALHLGLISATETVSPNVPVAVTKDRRQLLQVTIGGNHGDSGGPLIDLTSGHVVGVLLQIVPAPMAIGGQLVWDQGTFEPSGIMLAAPASWVNALLAKHHLSSSSQTPGKLFIF